jgi:hypothetical protein
MSRNAGPEGLSLLPIRKNIYGASNISNSMIAFHIDSRPGQQPSVIEGRPLGFMDVWRR